MELVSEVRRQTFVEMLRIVQDFTNQHSVKSNASLAKGIDDRGIRVASFE